MKHLLEFEMTKQQLKLNSSVIIWRYSCIFVFHQGSSFFLFHFFPQPIGWSTLASQTPPKWVGLTSSLERRISSAWLKVPYQSCNSFHFTPLFLLLSISKNDFIVIDSGTKSPNGKCVQIWRCDFGSYSCHSASL